jgi:hypothetical protein
MAKDELPELYRKAFSVVSFFDESYEKSYWLSKTPAERLEAIEIMRQIIYGCNFALFSLLIFFEVLLAR